MKACFVVLGLGLLTLLSGCEAGDAEIEPGPATEGVPGAAGSTSLRQWDTDPDAVISRDEFDAWWAEQEAYASWDTDADETLGAEEIAKGIFGTWDADDTGTLTPEEWARGMDAYHGRAYGSWDGWDRDGDRLLDEGEVAGGLERHGLFPGADADGDGAVDEAELSDWWFGLWDSDGDGALDRGEWEAMVAEWRQQERRQS